LACSLPQMIVAPRPTRAKCCKKEPKGVTDLKPKARGESIQSPYRLQKTYPPPLGEVKCRKKGKQAEVERGLGKPTGQIHLKKGRKKIKKYQVNQKLASPHETVIGCFSSILQPQNRWSAKMCNPKMVTLGLGMGEQFPQSR